MSRFGVAPKKDTSDEWAEVGDGWDLDLGEGDIVGVDNSGLSSGRVAECGDNAAQVISFALIYPFRQRLSGRKSGSVVQVRLHILTRFIVSG